MNEAVLKHRDGAVQVMSIHNATARHADTHALCAALMAALAEAQADPGIGAVVLTGIGDAFCTGADLDLYGQRSATTPRRASRRNRTSARPDPLDSQLHQADNRSSRRFGVRRGFIDHARVRHAGCRSQCVFLYGVWEGRAFAWRQNRRAPIRIRLTAIADGTMLHGPGMSRANACLDQVSSIASLTQGMCSPRRSPWR